MGHHFAYLSGEEANFLPGLLQSTTSMITTAFETLLEGRKSIPLDVTAAIFSTAGDYAADTISFVLGLDDDGGDLVYGNLGNDTLEGGGGADTVRGGQGDDIVRGGPGDDYLSGDLGSDTMTGGAGADVFHSFGSAGVDRVTDFTRREGDYVRLDLGTTYTFAQQGSDVVISLGGGGQMTLVNVFTSQLTPGWIVVG